MEFPTALVVEHKAVSQVGSGFRFPFRSASGRAGMGIGNAPAVAEATDSAGGSEECEHFAQALVAHTDASAQLGAGQRSLGPCERLEHELVKRGGHVVARSVLLRVDVNLQMDVALAHERQRDGLWRRSAPVFDAELESSMVAPHVQQRIGPREEVSRAAQALAGLARAS